MHGAEESGNCRADEGSMSRCVVNGERRESAEMPGKVEMWLYKRDDYINSMESYNIDGHSFMDLQWGHTL